MYQENADYVEKLEKSSARPRLIKRREDRILHRLVQSNRRLSATKLRDQWRSIFASDTYSTGFLYDLLYGAKRPVCRHRLTNENRRLRLEWARRHRNKVFQGRVPFSPQPC